MGLSDTVNISVVIKTTFPALFAAARKSFADAKEKSQSPLPTEEKSQSPLPTEEKKEHPGEKILEILSDGDVRDETLVVEAENTAWEESMDWINRHLEKHPASPSPEEALDVYEELYKTVGSMIHFKDSRMGESQIERFTKEAFNVKLRCLWNQPVLLIVEHLHQMTRWGYDHRGSTALCTSDDFFERVAAAKIKAKTLAAEEFGLKAFSIQIATIQHRG